MQTNVDIDALVADILGKLDRSADRILSQQVTWLGTVARAQRTRLAAASARSARSCHERAALEQVHPAGGIAAAPRP